MSDTIKIDWTAAKFALRWTPWGVGIGVPVGAASAVFLIALDWATRQRIGRPSLLFALPAAGAAVGWVYHRFGGDSGRGNNLIVEQIHQPGGGVPRRMAPLVFAATIVTHLFGGSAGREGTAVQMGGSIAGGLARAFRLEGETLRIALMCGVAAGFGSVFGTPLAGAVFALEVLAIGAVRYEALFPCLVASVAADWFCRLLGVRHTVYEVLPLATATGAALAAKSAAAGAVFGLVGLGFAEATHRLQGWFARFSPEARPAVGGVLVILLTGVAGTRMYLGLGIPGILAGFSAGGVGPFAWLWKSIFTAVTVASGFKGGEVTPLFFIGSALGNALAGLMRAPVDLFAGLGMIAVFAGAANTPLACALMGLELFGSAHAVPIALACFTAYLFSGHSGIYRSQRVAGRKGTEDGK